MSTSLRFELFVDDVEVSIRFYQAVLGLNPPPTYDPDGYVPVSDGAVTIGLQQHTALPPGHHFRPEDFKGPRGVGVEIVVEVNDVVVRTLDDSAWREAELVEVGPDRIRLRWMDRMVDQPPSGQWFDLDDIDLTNEAPTS